MDLQYVMDINGHKNAVQLPLSEWEHILRELEELDRLRNKKVFLKELAEAVEEMKQIKKGTLDARNAEDLLNEL